MNNILKTPDEWQRIHTDAIIYDADGWRSPHYKSWSEPISEKEFLERRTYCTCKQKVKKK